MDDEERTFQRFRFYPGAETWVLKGELCRLLRVGVVELETIYPSLFIRRASPDELSHLLVGGFLSPADYNADGNKQIYLVRASDVDTLLEGNEYEDNYRQEPLPPSAVSGGPGVKQWGYWIPQVPKGTYSDLKITQGLRPNNPFSARLFASLGHAKESQKLESMAEKEEISVPIRLELEHGGLQLRDQFLWNINDEIMTAADFANMLCDDLGLPAVPWMAMVRDQIDDQLTEFRSKDFFAQTIRENRRKFYQQYGEAMSAETSKPDTKPGTGSETVTVESKSVKSQADSTKGDDDADQKSVTAASLGVAEGDRIVLRLNIHVGNVNLTDCFEWDLGAPDYCITEFAQQTVTELALPISYVPIIDHAIRAQLMHYIKSVTQGEFVENVIIEGPEDAAEIYRDEVNEDGVEWGPSLTMVSREEIERIRVAREREARRLRRSAARRR
eukprot:Clim_evm97s157 gene=Clim_evmTU97s157